MSEAAAEAVAAIDEAGMSKAADAVKQMMDEMEPG